MAAINNLRTLATYRDQKPTGRGSPKRHPNPPFFHSAMPNVALIEGESELGLQAVLHLVVELLKVGHVFVCLQ